MFQVIVIQCWVSFFFQQIGEVDIVVFQCVVDVFVLVQVEQVVVGQMINQKFY